MLLFWQIPLPKGLSQGRYQVYKYHKSAPVPSNIINVVNMTLYNTTTEFLFVALQNRDNTPLRKLQKDLLSTFTSYRYRSYSSIVDNNCKNLIWRPANSVVLFHANANDIHILSLFFSPQFYLIHSLIYNQMLVISFNSSNKHPLKFVLL